MTNKTYPYPNSGQVAKPSRKSGIRYLIALALFVAGNYLAGDAAYRLYQDYSTTGKSHEFIVPGATIITIESPGWYTFWNDFRTEYEGRLYNSGEDIAGGFELFLNDEAGQALTIESSMASSRVSFGSNHERVAIGQVQIYQTGNYKVNVTGNFSERVFSLRPALIGKIIVKLPEILGGVFLAWIIAPIVALVALFSSLSASNQPASKLPSSLAQSSDLKSNTPSPEECKIASFAHLITFIGFIIPFGTILGPVIMWSFNKEKSEFIDSHFKSVINFQISLFIYTFIAAILIIILVGIILLLALFILWIISTIRAMNAASRGEQFNYPLAIEFIKSS